jgi:hypothetical protein
MTMAGSLQVNNQIEQAAHPLVAWPTWPLKAILVVLFLGPLIAPLFQMTYLPLVADSGALARDLLSRYVCPTPAKSYVLLGFPMAVCARCWGATVGLWAAWLLLGSPATGRWSVVARMLAAYRALSWPLRLLLSALPFLLWVGEINLWTAAPYRALLLNGAQAGFWAGLFFLGGGPGAAVSPSAVAPRPPPHLPLTL